MNESPIAISDELEPLVRIARRMLRLWRPGAMVGAAVLAVALVTVALLPKRYRSEAVLYYREGLQWAQSDSVGPRRIGQKLKEMLLSRAQLGKLVDEFGLYPKLLRAGKHADAVEEMREDTAFRFADGDVFLVSFTGATAEEAQRVTARLTELLVAQNAELRAKQAEVASEFLKGERDRTAKELAEQEAEQLRFLAEHPEFAQERAPTVGVTLRARTRELATSSRDDSPLGALLREEKRLSLQLSSPGEVVAAPPDPELVAAKRAAEQKLAEAKRELEDRKLRFTEQHPDVRMAANLVAEAQAAAARAAQAVAQGQVPVSADVLRKRLEAVRREIADWKRAHPGSGDRPRAFEMSDAAKRIVAVETEWARLGRQVEESRDRLGQLENQQFTAAMTASMVASGQAGQIVVVDPAYLPARPEGMSWARKLLSSLVLALFAAVAYVLGRALLDDVVQERHDLERLRIAPVLVEVPGMARLAASQEGPRTQEAKERGWTPAVAGKEPAATPPPGNGMGVYQNPYLVPRQETSGGEAGVAAVKPASTALSIVQEFSRERRVYIHVPVGNAELASVLGRSEVLEATGAPSVGRRPRDIGALDPRLVMLADPDGRAAAAFRVLRHRLSGRGDTGTILVTSPEAGEGKSLVAANLAFALAEGGQARVLLLESNFRAPTLAKLIGTDPLVCLTQQFEIHARDAQAPWTVVETPEPSLHVAAVAPSSAARPMDGATLGLCISNLRRAGYEHIVLDSPPVLASADVNLIEESVDGILLVQRAGRSRVGSLRKAVEQVGSEKLLGLVLLED